MNIGQVINEVVTGLTTSQDTKKVYRHAKYDEVMPSVEMLGELVTKMREIIFPGYYGNSAIKQDNVQFYLGVNINRVYTILERQIKRGLCFSCALETNFDCNNCSLQAEKMAKTFVAQIPELKRMLYLDVQAAYEGDPASKSIDEVIFCFPAIKALVNYRVAHCLLKLNVPLLPRIISEMAHSETGVDIHPGAEIGEYFTIDHGTGTVIGETCVIGNHVKLYHGVTLGAKSFPLDENGNPIKGIPRHPIVEDGVVIYSHATILGRITIGANSSIGGNVWITNSLPPNSKVVQQKPKDNTFIYGAGI